MLFILLLLSCTSKGNQGEWISATSNQEGSDFKIRVNSCTYSTGSNIYAVTVDYTIDNVGKVPLGIGHGNKAIQDSDGRKWFSIYGDNGSVQPLEKRSFISNFQIPGAANIKELWWGLAKQNKDTKEWDLTADLLYKIKLEPKSR